jgi:hypothetical protein
MILEQAKNHRRLGMFKFLVLALFISVSSWGGQEVGNPGDAVSCKSSSENSLDGIYSLDFLMTQGSSGHPIETGSWESSLYRIRQALYTKVPELLKSFDDFYVSILSEDPSLPMFWEKAPLPYQLINLKDPDPAATVQLPKNCRNENGDLQIIQAVIREHREFSGSPKTVFKYASTIIDTMKTEKPLQLSYLLVHEWLWSLSDNIDRNRRLTHFLHTEEFFKMTRAEIIQNLQSMGLDVSSIPVVVAADGSGQFVSLETAIEQNPQATIFHLKEGRYFSTGKTISRAVRIIGLGKRDLTIISGTSTEPALRLALPNADTGFEVRNVWLQKDAEKAEDGLHPAVEILSGSPLITECRFGHDPNIATGYSMTGLQIRGNATPKIIGNDFVDLFWGVVLQDHAGGELKGNHYLPGADVMMTDILFDYSSTGKPVIEEAAGTKIVKEGQQ